MLGNGHPTVGLALVVRNEEEMLPGLMRSIEGAFDQVALLDTGSTDGTVPLFRAWADSERSHRPAFSAEVALWAWRDDFAAARNQAERMLGTEWWVWADADDEIIGARELRRLAAAAPPEIVAFVAGYELRHSASGEVTSYTQRVRMVRAGKARWRYPVHEEQVVDGGMAGIADSTTRWIHRPRAAEPAAEAERNIRILHSWVEREPESSRAHEYLGREQAVRGRHEPAVEHFRRCLALPTRDEERAKVRRELAVSLMALGRLEEAEAEGTQALLELPWWPDGHLTLAEVALERGDAAAAIEHAGRVLELGPPRTTLPRALTDYTSLPRELIARALSRA